MKYYKVRPEFDNKRVTRNGYYLVGNELYTPAELRRLETRYKAYYRNPMNFSRMFEEVEVSKRTVYFCFGARFSPTTGGWQDSVPVNARLKK